MSETIQHKLYHLEEMPPASVWQDIEKELDAAKGDNQIREKLFAQEANPPASIWHSIHAALEAEPAEELSARLYEAEITPPIMVWETIETALDTPPLKKRIPLVRYGIAAALVGLMALAGFRLFVPSSNNKVAATEIKIMTPSSPLDLVKEADPNDKAVTEDTRNDMALEQSKKTFAKLEMNRKQKARIASGFRFASDNNDPLIADNSSSTYMADRYIVLMTPEGNFIRVSKKLGNMVCCVSGEEQDKECREQVEKWKKQLACSSASHPGNFGDILSLISALQEGN